MWGRGGRTGRHAAPTARGARRPADRARPAPAAEQPDRTGAGSEDGAVPQAGTGTGTGRRRPLDGPRTEPIAIIGGSVVPLLAGRLRRRHVIADVETPTAALALAAAAGPTGEADPGRGRRCAASRTRRGRPAAGPGSAGRRRVAVAVAAVGVLAGLVAAGAVLGPWAARPADRTAAPGSVTPGSGAPAAADPTAADPAAADPTAPVAPLTPLAGPPTTAAAGPAAERRRAYLRALRSADIPASRSGEPEAQAAATICERSRRGVPDRELARSLPTLLTEVDRAQAGTVVELAKRYYCP